MTRTRGNDGHAHRSPGAGARRRRGALTALILATAALVLSAAGPAAAAPTGSISGTVTDTAHHPVADVWVWASNANGNVVGQATTAADGTYAIAGLTAGSYDVFFFPDEESDLIGGMYDEGRPDATIGSVELLAGAALTGIDGQLAQGGSISGTVRYPNGRPVRMAMAMAIGDLGGQGRSTDADGAYVLHALEPGTYVVRFAPPERSGLAGEYYGGRRSFAEGEPIEVTAAARRSGIDGVVGPGGAIDGTVTDDAGAPQAGVLVQADPIDASASLTVQWGTKREPGQAVTNAAGHYTVLGLDNGPFRVRFQPPTDATEAQTWAAPDGDSRVQVSAPATTSGIDARLLRRVRPDTAPPVSEPVGPTPSVTTPGPKPPVTAPTPRTSIPRLKTTRGTVSRTGRVPLLVACPRAAGPCTGTLRLSTGKGRKRTSLATTRYAIPAGRTTPLEVTVNGAGRRLLRGRRTALAVTATFTPTNGTAVTTRATLRAKAR